MKIEEIRATLTMGEEKRLTMRIFLTDKQKETFILEKGRQPIGMIDLIIL